MTNNVTAFDQWIRDGFVQMNTELEELYFAQEDRADVAPTGQSIKDQLVAEGRSYVVDLLQEGNTDEGFAVAIILCFGGGSRSGRWPSRTILRVVK